MVKMHCMKARQSSGMVDPGGDVEERNSVLGALRYGVILWERVKGLQVDQHLIRLVYTTEGRITWVLTREIHSICSQNCLKQGTLNNPLS